MRLAEYMQWHSCTPCAAVWFAKQHR